MSLSNSISLIADKYYTIDEETGQLIDLTSLIVSSTTVLDEEILKRKANIIDVNNTFNTKLNISTYDNFRLNILSTTLNSKLNISNFDDFTNNKLPGTFNSKLNISDFDDFRNNKLPGTFNSKLNTSIFDDFKNNTLAGTFNSKLNTSIFDDFRDNILPGTFNSKLNILDFNNTNLANLKIADFNVTASSLLSGVSITDFSKFQGTTNSELSKRLLISDFNTTNTTNLNNINSRLLISDFNTTNTANLNNINSRVLSTDYEAFKVANTAAIAEKVNILDYNANNILLGTQIASKLSSSTFNLFQIENTTNINSKLDKEVYNITNQSVLDLINLRAGEFTPIPPLYFQLNISGQTPIMNLVLSENEITTFTNFHNRDEITTKFNTVNANISNKVSLNLLINILDDYDNTSTVNSKLTNYLGYDVPRTTATIKSISMSDWNLLKFEDGSTPIMIIDRVNSWGYTANTVIAANLGSLQNIWCATNMYLRSNSKLYLNDPETEYLTTGQLLNVSGSTSNLQTQINNKLDSTSVANNITTLNISCVNALYFNDTTTIYCNSLRTTTISPWDLGCLYGCNSNLQNQITNNLTSLNNAINLRISSATLASTLTLYDTTAVINTKLVNTIKYDTIRSDSLNKVVNLSGLSSLSFDTYPTADDVYKKDFYYDISNSGSYTRNSVFAKYLRSDNLWVEGNLRLNPGNLILDNPQNFSSITTTNLSFLANSTSNLQQQLELKLTTGTTLAGGDTGKSISIDIINPISGSTFQGGNKIWLNAQEVQCPYRLAVTDLIYTGEIYCFDIPLGTLISDDVNSKLSDTVVKYDTIRSDNLNKVVNLSGLSSLSFDTYHTVDGVYKKDFFYDISNSGSYTRNSVFAKYLRSNNLWVEGNLRMNPGTLILDNPLNVSSITTTNLSFLTNSSSNLQEQLDMKQPKFLYAGRISATGTVVISVGRLTVTSAMITMPATGDYVFTLPTAHPSGANYLVMVSACASAGTIALATGYANSSTQFTINMYTNAGAPYNTPFCFDSVP
jgi:hypothetical protein